MQNRLKELQKLTQLMLDGERAKLQSILIAEQEKHDQVKELDISCAERARSITNTLNADVALYAGADELWGRWRQKEKSNLNTQRAALIAERDVQRLETKKAFGKNEAVRRLMEEEAAKTKEKARRV